MPLTLRYASGHLLDNPALDAVVHQQGWRTVNGEDVTLIFSTRFPEVMRRFKPSRGVYVQRVQGHPAIIHFPTDPAWKEELPVGVMLDRLRDMKRIFLRYHFRRVGLYYTPMGWLAYHKLVRGLVVQAWGALPVELLVYGTGKA